MFGLWQTISETAIYVLSVWELCGAHRRYSVSPEDENESGGSQYNIK